MPSVHILLYHRARAFVVCSSGLTTPRPWPYLTFRSESRRMQRKNIEPSGSRGSSRVLRVVKGGMFTCSRYLRAHESLFRVVCVFACVCVWVTVGIWACALTCVNLHQFLFSCTGDTVTRAHTHTYIHTHVHAYYTWVCNQFGCFVCATQGTQKKGANRFCTELMEIMRAEKTFNDKTASARHAHLVADNYNENRNWTNLAFFSDLVLRGWYDTITSKSPPRPHDISLTMIFFRPFVISPFHSLVFALYLSVSVSNH